MCPLQSRVDRDDQGRIDRRIIGKRDLHQPVAMFQLAVG